MDCQEFLTRYSEYDDSQVTSSEEARFQAHLESCASCARYDRVLRKGRMVARQLRVDSAPDFLTRLDQRLWRESHRARRSGLRRPAQVAAALAALTVLLAASAAIGLLGVGTSPDGSASLLRSAVRGVAPAAVLDSSPAGVRDSRSVRVRGSGSAQPVGSVRPGAAGRPARVAALPVMSTGSSRDWATPRVAPPSGVTYSPLVLGPPAYRRTPGPAIPVHTLD